MIRVVTAQDCYPEAFVESLKPRISPVRIRGRGGERSGVIHNTRSGYTVRRDAMLDGLQMYICSVEHTFDAQALRTTPTRSDGWEPILALEHSRLSGQFWPGLCPRRAILENALWYLRVSYFRSTDYPKRDRFKMA